MVKRNKNIQQIPVIDDSRMTKTQQDAMWERLATQEEVFFGVGDPRREEVADKSLLMDVQNPVAV